MALKLRGYILWCMLAFVIAAVLAFQVLSKRTSKSDRPNVILITIDALRPDHLGCYGYSRNTSPNIDKFASEGLLFENCFSNATETRYSFSSILTGFLPHETRVFENVPLPEDVDTLAEILRKEGYKTAAVVSNYMLKKKRGYAQGFRIYDDAMDEMESVRKWPERTAEHTTDRAIEFLKRFRKDSLFMWIHYQDPHGPYTPPKPFSEMFFNPSEKSLCIKVNKSLSGYGGIPYYQNLGADKNFDYYVSQYDGEIRYQDAHFKRLIDALKRFGFYEQSLIIVTSDHGESMGEHNYFFAHGENLYNELMRVPLIIRYGKKLRGGRADFVQHLDIVPTVLETAGLMKNPKLRGRDLRLKQDAAREIYAEMNSPFVLDSLKFCLIYDGLKLIHTLFSGRYELFDLGLDPDEEHNLINDPRYYAQTEDLKVRLARIRNEDFLKLNKPGKLEKTTEEELEKLKSLGYVR